MAAAPTYVMVYPPPLALSLVYGNHCFTYKRGRPPAPSGELPPCYRRGKLHQERQVADEFTTWTPDAIERRQQMLADWASERWAVEPPEGAALVEALADEAEEPSHDEAVGATP
jgi:hypothetical protein